MGNKKKEIELLVTLCQASSLAEARDCIRELVEQFKYSWRAVGDRENNYGHINIGSNPGHALVERVTNAIDAVIEREAAFADLDGGDARPSSPREASELWFDVEGGRLAGIDDPSRQALSDNVTVTLVDSGNERQPSVEIRDLGVGIAPSEFPGTIFSLGGSNKIDKPYLAGAFGQGGSTALAFSPDGAVVASRKQPKLLKKREPDVVGVTFARFNELDIEVNKNGRYEYLVGPKGEVPGFPSKDLPGFEAGTRVIHFKMQIEKYSKRMTQLKSSLWWLLQNTMFDPVLPIWAVEARKKHLKKKKIDRRTIIGNHNRLFTATKAPAHEDDSDARVEHADSVDVFFDHLGTRSKVRAYYWVLRHDEGGSSRPIESYVDPYEPVAYTLFGQTHGTDDRRLIRERLSLPYLANYLVVQVELDSLSARVKRDLLSSTRDRMKDSALYDILRESLSRALSEDEHLVRLNDERKEKILARHSDKDREKIRQKLARLMRNLTAGATAQAPGKGGTEDGRRQTGGGTREPLTPLPTRKEPTFIRVANAQKPVPVQVDRNALIKIESDAPDRYISEHIHSNLVLLCDPQDLVLCESRSDFRGGRARIVVRPGEGARPGADGTVVLILMKASGEELRDTVKVRIDAPKEEPTSGDQGKAKVNVPDPIPIQKDQWGELGWDETSVSEVHVDGADIKIYVNIDNQHIAALLRGAGYEQTGITRMRGNYLLYTAFYSWLQHLGLSQENHGLEGEEFELYRSRELDRVAQTVVHSISSTGRMMEAADE